MGTGTGGVLLSLCSGFESRVVFVRCVGVEGLTLIGLNVSVMSWTSGLEWCVVCVLLVR